MAKIKGNVSLFSILLLALFAVALGLTACGTPAKAVSSINLDKTTLSLIIGKSEHITATVHPANAVNTDVTWNSDKPDIVSVSPDGTVTANAIGSATITVTSADGQKTANCAVAVKLISMIQIKGGTFTMGSDPTTEKEINKDEYPQPKVTVSDFQIGEYKITQKQWEFVMGNTPSFFKGSGLPVEQISWYDALVFCNKLSMIENLTPAYTIGGSTDPADWGAVPKAAAAKWDSVQIAIGAKGYRLPTEAQWEYACRAGTTTPFYTGHELSTQQANYDGRHPYGRKSMDASGLVRNKTTEVGSFEPNPWGLYDMHGNVWEWCWDGYGFYEGTDKVKVDPKGADTTRFRVARGGAWNSKGATLRSASRGSSVPYFTTSGSGGTIGLRVVSP